MITATEIKRIGGWRSDARLFRLSEAVAWGDDGGTTRYIIVSAVVVYSRPETYIFASDENGDVLDWSEMDGSYRGGLSHVKAINNAGWEMKTTGYNTDTRN